MIVVEKEKGKIFYNENEIIAFTEEQIKMIPGIVKLGKKSPLTTLKELLKVSSGGVKVSQINKNEIFIDLYVVLNKDINFLEVEGQIKDLLKYSLYKKYGLTISNIDVYIEDLI